MKTRLLLLLLISGIASAADKEAEAPGGLLVGSESYFTDKYKGMIPVRLLPKDKDAFIKNERFLPGKTSMEYDQDSNKIIVNNTVHVNGRGDLSIWAGKYFGDCNKIAIWGKLYTDDHQEPKLCKLSNNVKDVFSKKVHEYEVALAMDAPDDMPGSRSEQDVFYDYWTNSVCAVHRLFAPTFGRTIQVEKELDKQVFKAEGHVFFSDKIEPISVRIPLKTMAEFQNKIESYLESYKIIRTADGRKTELVISGNVWQKDDSIIATRKEQRPGVYAKHMRLIRSSNPDVKPSVEGVISYKGDEIIEEYIPTARDRAVLEKKIEKHTHSKERLENYLDGYMARVQEGDDEVLDTNTPEEQDASIATVKKYLNSFIQLKHEALQ